MMNRRSFLRFLGVSPALSVVDMSEVLESQKDPWGRQPYVDWREMIMMEFPNGDAPLIRMMKNRQIKLRRIPLDPIYKLYE